LIINLVKQVSNQVFIQFQVADTGIGISRGSLHLLFQRFTQVDSSTTRIFGGTGLGLTISQSIVESMKGHIDVHSEESKGSTFEFTCAFELPSEEQLLEFQNDTHYDYKIPGYGELENDTSLDLDADQTAPTGSSIAIENHILIAEDNHINVSYILLVLIYD
jgi:hypothetical protein